MSELSSHGQVLINAVAALNEADLPANALTVTASGPNTDESKTGEYSATLTGNGTTYDGSVVITFDRLAVDEVILAANIDVIAVRATAVTGEQVAQLIRDHLDINILASDLTAESFGPFEGRTTVTVEVKSDSLLFRGSLDVIIDPPRFDEPQDGVTLINTGREPLVPEDGLIPGPQVAGHTLNIFGETKENGHMAHGTGNRAGEFTNVTNGELSLSLSTRIWKKTTPDAPDANGVYQHVLTPAQDWNVPFSIALTDAAPQGSRITDLYDIQFAWGYKDTEEMILWTLKENEGNFVLEAADGMRITDSSVYNNGRVLQNIQRMSHYVDNISGNKYFTPSAATDIGGILGEFHFTIQATRKNSLAQPLVLSVASVAGYAQPE